ncbi:MAG: hypothetical protein ACD_15C00075G0005 [uncultured bacterium]|nr:MAG: hypothetical protein ACD_15C00075G0005 [uncultured bacterium]HCU71198.1 hypothetical protein [Candidatus Moranbacteria bacterium]
MGKNKKKIKQAVTIILIAFFAVWNFSDGFVVFASDDVEKTKDALESVEKKMKREQAELNASQSVYSKVTAQVGATKSLLNQTATEISRKEAEIKNLNDQISLYKKVLTTYLQEMYFGSGDDLIKLALSNGAVNDIFGMEDQNLNIKEKILALMEEINSSQDKLSEVKEDLSEKKQEHEKILQQKKLEQGEIASDIQETQATIAELQKKFNELQGELNALLGTNYNAKDIKDAVSYASKKTGVSQGVLYGFLKQETNLGKNTGQCTYADVKKVSIAGYKKYGKKYQASIDRLYHREKLFNSIIDDLGYKSKKVSCTIPFSSAGPNQGGAMGVAQFMSDTWLAYESRISANTGHKKPDPWNITDGVMGLAIKVANAGGTSDSASAIRKATINYYGAFSQGYYNTVIYWSKNYKKLI